MKGKYTMKLVKLYDTQLKGMLQLVKDNPELDIDLLLKTMGVESKPITIDWNAKRSSTLFGESVNKTKENDFNNNSWQDDETQLLRDLLDEYGEVKSIPIERIFELSKLLNRTHGAITSRLYGIKKGVV